MIMWIRCIDTHINKNILWHCVSVYQMSLIFWLPPRGRFRNWNPLLYFHRSPHFLPQWLPYFLQPPFLHPSCFPHDLFSPHAVRRMWIANRYRDHTEMIRSITLTSATSDSKLARNKQNSSKQFVHVRVVRMTKSRGCEIYGRTEKNEIVVGRPKGNRPLGRPTRRWEDNNRAYLREII